MCNIFNNSTTFLFLFFLLLKVISTLQSDGFLCLWLGRLVCIIIVVSGIGIGISLLEIALVLLLLNDSRFVNNL